MKPYLLSGLTVIWAASLSGCASIESLNPFSQKEEIVVATPENPAFEVVCLWQPGQGRNERGIPTRGFDGQILFFTRKDDTPVVVDGDVKIYQFDDYGPREEWDKPIAEFSFTSEQWQYFLGKGLLGPGYHLFIPYSREHSEQVNVSLMVRFTPHGGGQPLYSKLIKATLPGTFESDEVASGVRDYTNLRDADGKKIEQVVGEQMKSLKPSAPAPAPQSGLQAQTIHRFMPARSEQTPATMEPTADGPIRQVGFEEPSPDEPSLLDKLKSEAVSRRFEVSAMHSTMH